MGIRKRIFIGFISLAMVLFFAGAIAMSELGRLRGTVHNIVETSTRSTEYAKLMLNALQEQNSAILRMMFSGGDMDGSSQQYLKGVEDFNGVLLEATETVGNRVELDAIYSANDAFRKVIEEHIASVNENNDPQWFLNMYMKAYYDLDTAIKDYMTAPQNSIAVRTVLLEENVYRTITPSILTLLVAFLIVLMFYYFLDLYFLRPVLKINKEVRSHLDFGTKFNVKIEGSGEISNLRDNIQQLIERVNTKKG